ncbi:MAG: hypothetical protein U0167_05260 [bacterium]
MTARAAEKRWLKIASGVASCPTATYLEHAPAAWIRAFVRRRPALAISEDAYGNLLVRYPAGRPPRSAPLALVAHLDHPGFVVQRVYERRVDLEFRGGVRRRHARPGTRVEFFRVGRTAPIGRGVLLRVRSSERGTEWLGGATARLVQGRVEEGGFAMWALPALRIHRGTIVGRALDDLLGAAAALAALDEIARRRPRGVHVLALFTRAEEVGFHGALAALRARTVPHDARVLSLETSRALSYTPLGSGVIVRVGDARSLFHAPLTDVIVREARALAAADRGFRFQRRLMDGGSCEATPFCADGYAAGGLCVPLGNYHNQRGLDGGRPGIGAEHVRTRDFRSEVQLLVRLAESSARLGALERESRDWLVAATDRAVRSLDASPRLDARPAPRGRRR